eukprot:2139810-Prymnesium_polylepis.1
MQLRGRRAVGGMHNHRLQATDRSPQLRSSGLINQCAHMIRRCRAGGRRQAGAHHAERRRRPPRRRSGAVPPHR